MPGARAVPSGLSAKSWLVADMDTGDILAARNPHRRLAPASTLKTLFAVTLLPRISQDAVHRVTDEDLAGVEEGSSRVGLQPGLDYAVPDLWRGVFLSSGNDAVHVLARMNGSVKQTVVQMQARAKELGARDTHVVSPDGYDAPGQVSSAYDLALFGRAGLADPAFARYCSTASAEFPGVGPSGAYRIENTNRLLSGIKGVEPYAGLIGVKNGYTTHAGNTLIAAARRGGHTVIVTVMNPKGGEEHGVYDEARTLLDWGFEAGGQIPAVGSLNPAKSGHPSASPSPQSVSAAAPQQPSLTRWGLGAAGVGVAAVAFLTWRRRTRARTPRL
jgi:D-alanyl-D-alanine carboxypeptidase (penicillin-binding protein 5/6)